MKKIIALILLIFLSITPIMADEYKPPAGDYRCHTQHCNGHPQNSHIGRYK